ncbi:transposase InsO family protein [Paraburkholderia sp. UCT70]
MIDRTHALPVSQQARLVGIARSSVYYRAQPVSNADQLLMRRIDELHMEFPFAGARMLARLLRREGHEIGRRHVRTLMKRMGIEALYCKPNTSRRNAQHKIWPYLLRGMTISRANQVWALDTSYIPMARGFVYLTAVVDWASRKVLAHRVAITMEAMHAVEALEEAFAKYGQPEIVNTDQGSQFTAIAFTEAVLSRGIRLSMDGKGAWRDNVFVERVWRSVKYEEVVCYERDGSKSEPLRCFIKDEGGPLGVGVQEQASNHHKLRELRARVVSVDGKGGARLRQVRVRKTNASEPLMTCRNVLTEVETGILTSIPRQRLGAYLLAAQLASGMKAA